MSNTFLRVYEFYGRFLYYAAVLSGGAIFFVMWLIDTSALTRKLFNSPVPGSVEISEALLVVGIMLPMAYAQYTRAHVRVTLLTKHTSPRIQQALFIIAMLVGFVITSLMAWAAFNYALRSFDINEYVWGARVRFPLYPIKATLCFGFVMLALQFLLDMIKISLFGLEAETEDEIAASLDGKEDVIDE